MSKEMDRQRPNKMDEEREPGIDPAMDALIAKIRKVVEKVVYQTDDGTKLQIIQPSDALEEFNYKGVTGALDV